MDASKPPRSYRAPQAERRARRLIVREPFEFTRASERTGKGTVECFTSPAYLFPYLWASWFYIYHVVISVDDMLWQTLLS